MFEFSSKEIDRQQFHQAHSQAKMAKSQDQTASYMMLCLGDFASMILIPAKFVRKYEEIDRQVSVTLENDSGKSWDVKLKRMNGDLYITDGWAEFVKENGIIEPYFLTFRLLMLPRLLTFKVSIYRADGCIKHFGGEDVEILHKNVIKRGRRGRSFKIHAGRRSKARNDVVKDNKPVYLEICLRKHEKSRVSLPAAFWKVGGMRGRRDVTMEYVATGDCKTVVLDHRLYRTDLTRGWPEFRKANGIAVGKTYSFEFNPNRNVIRVKELVN